MPPIRLVPVISLALVIVLEPFGHAQPVSLFNGKDLDNWDYDSNIWRVRDETITGGSLVEKVDHNDFISTKNSYQNFELRLKIKVTGTEGFINSGIQIRSVRVPNSHEMSGYQIDCGKGWFGKIYDESRRNKVIAEPVNAEALAAVIKETDWNEYVIRAEGPHIQTWINGVLAIDYTEQDSNVALDGHLGPQVHGGGKTLVQVKDLTIEELPATPNAPTWEKLGGYKPWPKPNGSAAQSPAAAKRDISYNDIQGAARSAEEQLGLFKVAPGYEIELVAREADGIGKFISVYFDQRGRLWTQTALEYPVDANENPAAAEALYAGKGRDKILVYPREALNAELPAGGLTNPAVFADGLAIPLGILPWGAGDSCYVQHGHDIKLYKDTNGDGAADESTVILTGFGIQDSHLFPHQFTRAPGGWIWLAQGLFNKSAVKQPDAETITAFDMCRMARFRPDGSGFEATSVGPNNVWGLAITGSGEAFIQEANDYGYPVMPFHEYAYYPGGAESLKKSYQPDFPPAAEFRMGGTGLSGLALIESGPLSHPVEPQPADLMMAVANPITSRIQTIAMHREGPSWKLQQTTDLLTCDDPFFRPVALADGPDGCIYIVDWYNKIISHNEVPRAHPDRDKTRGRIWRIRSSKAPHPEATKVASAASGAELAGSQLPPAVSASLRLRVASETTPPQPEESLPIPDFTRLSNDELTELLGTVPTSRAHLAWQTLVDRADAPSAPKFQSLALDVDKPVATRVQALWVWEQLVHAATQPLSTLLRDRHADIRREAARVVSSFATGLGAENVAYLLKAMPRDPNPNVRFTALCSLGPLIPQSDSVVDLIVSFAKPSLPGPLGQASRGNVQIPIGEAYDREFERFLVRMFLERYPDAVAKFLDSDAAAKLPTEARILASLALEPKTSASRVAKLLPLLERPPNDEELLRIAQFPDEPGAGEALKKLLSDEPTSASIAAKLLGQRTKLDSSKLAPWLIQTAQQQLASSDMTARKLGLQIVSGFQLTSLEDDIVTMVKAAGSASGPSADDVLPLLATLRELRSDESEMLANFVKSGADAAVRDEALAALAASRAPDAAARLIALYPELEPGQQKDVLTALSGQAEGGAKALVGAFLNKTIPVTDLDASVAERLNMVLGDHAELAKLMQQLGHVFRPVVAFDGKDSAWLDTKLALDGPFTVETWVRLAPDIDNNDGILGAPGQIDMNFFQSKFRVWVGGLNDVVVAKKPMAPDLWTHLAVTRNAEGLMKIYINGELDAQGNKPAPQKFTDLRLGWTQPNRGTEGALVEFRLWPVERSAAEIRANFDRALATADSAGPDAAPISPLADDHLKPLLQPHSGVAIVQTTDYPPLLTTEQAAALDQKQAKYMKLGQKGGDVAKGKTMATLCLACHLINGQGGQIGPELSGAGAMGLEGVLRNLLTPNAAMEAGYRIYRVELKSGDLVDAFFVSEDKDAIVVRQPGVPDRRIARKDIRSTRYIRRSLMPEGLLDALPDQSAADLLAYLMTLK